MLTAVILTKNNQDVIEDCIKSVKFSDDIIVIDDNSSDDTVKICSKLQGRVFAHKLNDDFSIHRNFALSKVVKGWILYLDSDERITPELQDEIIKVTSDKVDNNIQGYFIRRQDIIFAKKLHHGEFGNIKLLRLAKKGNGEWKRKVHEYWDISGDTAELSNPLIHYSHKNISELITSINTWSSLHAVANAEEGKHSSLLKIIFMPLAHFFNNFIFKFGFLDGLLGFVLAIFMSFHSFLSWSKLWMLQKGFTKI